MLLYNKILLICEEAASNASMGISTYAINMRGKIRFFSIAITLVVLIKVGSSPAFG